MIPEDTEPLTDVEWGLLLEDPDSAPLVEAIISATAEKCLEDS